MRTADELENDLDEVVRVDVPLAPPLLWLLLLLLLRLLPFRLCGRRAWLWGVFAGVRGGRGGGGAAAAAAAPTAAVVFLGLKKIVVNNRRFIFLEHIRTWNNSIFFKLTFSLFWLEPDLPLPLPFPLPSYSFLKGEFSSLSGADATEP